MAVTVAQISAAPGVLTAPEVEQILDAALKQFADLGVRRTTIGDIARRAGVDRVTVYRRVGSKDDLVQAVVAREANRLFDEVMQAARRAATIQDRVAEGFATIIERLRQNAMLARQLDLEPEILLPKLTTQASTLLTTAIAATMLMFEQAREDGLLDDTDDLSSCAEVLVRVVHSHLLTPHAVLRLQTRAELLAFAHRHLAPMMDGRGPG